MRAVGFLTFKINFMKFTERLRDKFVVILAFRFDFDCHFLNYLKVNFFENICSELLLIHPCTFH